MNSSIMKTLKYNKGSLTLIFTEQGQLLFRCKPYLLLESSFIMLPSLIFFQDYLKGHVQCDTYNLPVYLCDMIILNCDNHKSFMENNSFKNFIKKELGSVFIREGLKFYVTYLGYSCHFTINKIYANLTFEDGFEDSFEEICASVSSLNISDGSSMFENSVSDCSTPLCSTPISKNFLNYSNVFKPEKKHVSQFYNIHSKTQILIENSKQVHSCPDKVHLQHLGGLKKQVTEIQKSILPLLNSGTIDTEPEPGLILFGISGTGKTTVVQAISNEYNLSIINLDTGLFASDEFEFKCHLKKLHNEIIDSSPCIFFLENIDNLYKNGMDSYSHKEMKLTSLSTLIFDILETIFTVDDFVVHLHAVCTFGGHHAVVSCAACHSLQNLRHKVVVIGTAHDISSVHSSLRKPGVLEKEIFFEVPSADDRKEILKKILDQKHHILNTSDIAQISEMSHGFTGGDLKHLCDKAHVLSLKGSITVNDLKESLKDVKPSSMAEFMFEIPKVKWSDIGGMFDVKTAITEMVDWPLKHAEKFKWFGITPSRGILLYGPPGCSKTMMAKALVSESHLNFISIKGPQFFNKYVGESEKAVSELFRKARSAAPCVLFFDEIDSLTPVRGSTSGNSNVSERILTQLLVEIDGIDVLQGVSIIAATNRPDMIDPSFLRPGRFDRMIYVPLPDYVTRKEIFEAKLKNIPHASDINKSYLAETTEGYTGAEITEVCREAAMCAIKEDLTSSSSVITMVHFLNALKSVVPRTSKEMLQFYENYNKKM